MRRRKIRYIYDADGEKLQDGEKSQQESSASLKEASISPEIQKTLAEVFGRRGVRLDDGKVVTTLKCRTSCRRSCQRERGTTIRRLMPAAAARGEV